MSSSASSFAVLKQLTRALSLLTADARAAKVPLPVPFLQSYSFVEDRSSSSLSTSSSSSTSVSSFSPPPLLRAALGDDASDLDGEGYLLLIRESICNDSTATSFTSPRKPHESKKKKNTPTPPPY